MQEHEQLKRAIAHLESQRPAPGDAVVEAALGPLRQGMEALAGAEPGHPVRSQAFSGHI
jgi:hypothetical protein